MTTKKQNISIIYIVTLLIFLSTSAIAQNFSGQWNRTTLQLNVKVQSWGHDCGTKPRSYFSKKIKPTEILESGGHLFFSTGGLRTDRCNSPNPSLKTISHKKSQGYWSSVCETPAKISKFERIDYSLKLTSGKLIYLAKSTFNWTLNKDHCQVSWTEKRIYERPNTTVTPIISTTPIKTKTSPILNIHTDDSFAHNTQTPSKPACTPEGSPVRLVIFPQKSSIRPGEKRCFRGQAIDKNGCRFSTHVKWTISQNDITRKDLFKNGCFIAGDNAAESEGLYTVLAKAKKVSATTTIEVSFPDIGDLARARLDFPQDSDEINDNSPKEQNIISTPIIKSIKPVNTQQTTTFDKIIIIAALLLLLITAGLTTFFIYQKRISPSEEEIMPSSSDDDHIKYCPTCNRIFKADAQFCPHDATKLQIVKK